ncbi:MAG TPA: ATP-binding cassette domain-containing protein [Candidatus Acidoferrales bacterium]|nr:ATP-binding cassette domain-containing protein [Candidatus Acidoferrales bacterium]
MDAYDRILGESGPLDDRSSESRSNGNTQSEHYIQFDNVSKAFGDHLVLDDVSFHVDRGQTAVIMGRSGVGKSVTLKHIMGFLEPDAGRVIVAGNDITGWTEDQLAPIRKRVTMVFQSGALFDSLTIAENIAFPLADTQMPAEEIDARVRELADMLEIAEDLDKVPSELSTGAKRAVAIARALAQDPEAILYDEPTTMVDPLMAAHMGDLIKKLKQALHKTSIVVTHDTHLARKLADTVIFLQDGRVAFFGPWNEFEKSSDPFLKNFLAQDALIPALDVTL